MKPWLRAASAVLAVGWGANQFSPLLIVYRDLDHLSSSLVAAVFGAYVVSLIPALLIGAPLSAPAVVPYFAHLVVVAIAAVLAWGAPETSPASGRSPRLGNALRHPEFLRRVVPSAPLVFGAATTSFAVLPTVLPVPDVPIASSGAIAGLTLGSGLLVQPLARRLEQRRGGSVLTFGLVLVVLGFLFAALSVGLGAVVLLVPTAIVLGAGYGMLLVGGLSRVEALATAEELAGVTAVFYCLAYVGFGAPYLFTAVNMVVPAAVVFVVAAGVVVLLVPITAK